MFARSIAIAAIAAVAAAPAFAAEGQQTFRLDYTVSILGLTIGESSFRGEMNDGRFSLSGKLSSSGIARIFDKTTGTTRVSGRVDGASLTPAAYVLSYTSGDKKKRTSISFSEGRVTATENVPEPKRKKRTNWVELSDADLLAVTDPISSTIVRASGLEDVCNRTIKFYDGEMRADLKLSFVGVSPAKARGFDGNSVTCRAQFVPVGGYRQGQKSIEFLKNKGKITISFAELGQTGVYAPIKASANTEIGTLEVVASRFEAVR